jgi:hypothetical protein
MFRKVLPGSAFGILTTIAYRICVGKQKIFATNGNDQSDAESINSPAFRRKNGKFTREKILKM